MKGYKLVVIPIVIIIGVFILLQSTIPSKIVPQDRYSHTGLVTSVNSDIVSVESVKGIVTGVRLDSKYAGIAFVKEIGYTLILDVGIEISISRDHRDCNISEMIGSEVPLLKYVYKNGKVLYIGNKFTYEEFCRGVDTNNNIS